MKNSKDLVALLKEQSKQSTVDVFVPSVNRSVGFRPINVKQQKEIIKHSLSGLIGTIKLASTFNDIINTNSTEAINFLITDRNAILAQLRVASSGLIAVDVQGNRKTLKGNFNNVSNLPNDFEVIDGDISINLSVPTLSRDSLYYQDLLKRIDSDQIKADDLIVKTYINEIEKFITTFTVIGNSYDNDGILPDEVIDNMPTSILNGISDQISKYKEFDTSFLEFEDGTTAILNARFFCDVA